MKFSRAVHGLLSRGKDTGVSFAVERFWEHRFARFGDLQDLHIDSRAKRIRAQILLKGDQEPIILTVDRYEVKTEELHTFFVLREGKVSREWMNLVLQEQAVGKPFPIPEKYVHLIKMLL